MSKYIFILFADKKVELMRFILKIKERRIGKLEVKLTKKKDRYREYLKDCAEYCKQAYKKINL